MPVTPHADYTTTDAFGPARLLDGGSNDYVGTVRQVSGEFNIQVNKVDATYAIATAISATIPFTWTTGDGFSFTAVYEPA